MGGEDALDQKRPAERLEALAEARSTSQPDPHLVSLIDRGSFEAEQYRILRHLVEERSRQAGLRVLAVTSSEPGEGKTLTAINLAGALAQTPGTLVLLIDAELRQPAVMARLGLAGANSRGLVEAVTQASVGFGDVVQHSKRFNLSVMPAGSPPASPYEVLQSPASGRLFDEARGRYDYVVVDTPPAVAFPDYRLLEKWIDGSLLVVAADRTPRKLVDAALGILDQSKLVGIVFNGANSGVAQSSYRSHYGSYYGKRPPSGG